MMGQQGSQMSARWQVICRFAKHIARFPAFYAVRTEKHMRNDV